MVKEVNITLLFYSFFFFGRILIMQNDKANKGTRQLNLSLQEMNLLVEANQPENQLDDYISRLNTILSNKAEGILQLQTRLAHFQRRLKGHNVLVSFSN